MSPHATEGASTQTDRFERNPPQSAFADSSPEGEQWLALYPFGGAVTLAAGAGVGGATAVASAALRASVRT